jgi:hypothetical protein
MPTLFSAQKAITCGERALNPKHTIFSIECIGAWKTFCLPPWGLFTSTTANDGTDWDTLYSGFYPGGGFVKQKDNIFMKREGNFLKSTNFGDSWIKLNSIVNPHYSQMFSIDSVLYILENYNNSKLYKSLDGGITWELIWSISLGPSRPFIKAENYLIGVREHSAIRSSDNGVNWEPINTGLSNDFYLSDLIYFQGKLFTWGRNLAPSNVSTEIYYSTNLGDSWINMSEGINSSDLYMTSLLASNNFLFAATSEHGLWRYDLSTLVDVDDEETFPTEFSLSQNYPNPFNPTTSIEYIVAGSEYVTLKVYDLLGREVATLLDEYKPAGSYEVEFDASHLSSGTYFYRLTAGAFVDTKKFILLK